MKINRMISLLFNVGQFAGKSGLTVYLVGGAVRDLVLGREFHDFDFLVLERSGVKKLADYFHRELGFHRPVLFSAIGGDGKKTSKSRRVDTYRTGKKEITVEIVPLRSETLIGDLKLRDFTINTLVIPVQEIWRVLNSDKSGTSRSAIKGSKFLTKDYALISKFLLRLVKDPLGKGKPHLKLKLIKTPISPALTFLDDPLRMLRAIRLSHELGFRLSPDLKKAIAREGEKISEVSQERIRDELEKIILAHQPSSSFRLMEQLGVLEGIFPEIQPMVGFEQKSPYHHEDLFNHSLSVMDRTPPDLALRLSALFHDAGKVDTERFVASDSAGKGGYYVYWGHQDYSASKVKSALTRLRFSRRLIKEVEFLVRNHMINYQSSWKEATVKRLVYRLGNHLDKVIELFKADCGSLRKPYDKGEEIKELNERISRIRAEEVKKIKSPLNGFEIQKILKVGPGKVVGEAKRKIIEAILDGKISPDPESAKRFLLSQNLLLPEEIPAQRTR